MFPYIETISKHVFSSCIKAPGSLRPLRTVRASFPAYGSGTFKAFPAKGNPAVNIRFFYHKCSNLFTFFS